MTDLVKTLTDKKLTIGSIESMTGGLFASTITSIAGSSKVFKGSVVSYSPLIKENVVGVKEETIKKFGVVSKEVAYEMAVKGRQLLDVDICVSVTGNAGPTCEPGQAGVGEVYIGVSTSKETVVISKKFEGDRYKIREEALLSMKEEVLILLEN